MAIATLVDAADEVQTVTEQPSGYRICVRCVMDTSDPEIEFDEAGVCHHCRGHHERLQRERFTGAEAERRLGALVDAIQREGRGKDYDCVIGVSGGVDSTYVAYQVRRLGLRPLAVHLDNGWDSELAVDNVKRMLDRMKIDLLTHVVDWDEFRDLQLAFLRASVPNLEIPTDHAIIALLLQTAARVRSRFVITGSNLATEGLMPFAWGYYSQDLRHLRAIHRRFGTRPLKTLPQMSAAGLLYSVLVRKVKLVPILNLLPYDKASAKQLIRDELGWRDYGGKHYESIFTRFFQGYILPRKFGYDKRRAHLSSLICSGGMTREQALVELQDDPYAACDLEQDREYVIKKFGLSASQFEELMRLPPRSHLEYESNHLLFHRLEKWKKWFRRIATQV